MAKFQNRQHEATSAQNRDLGMVEVREEVNIRPAIERLLEKDGVQPFDIRDNIVKFFRAYDECKEDQIMRM